MVNPKFWVLGSGLLIIIVLGIFLYKAEVFGSSFQLLFYLISFTIIFFPSLDINLNFSIKYVILSWFFLLIVGSILAGFLSEGHGSGLLGNYFLIYFLLYVFSPMIFILLLGFILIAVFSFLK